MLQHQKMPGGRSQRSHQPHEEQPPEYTKTKRRPLYFYYACETTGPSPLSDHIIEIGATVSHARIPEEQKTFSSLVHTTRPIAPAGR